MPSADLPRCLAWALSRAPALLIRCNSRLFRVQFARCKGSLSGLDDPCHTHLYALSAVRICV
jgi:hypothetical protein